MAGSPVKRARLEALDELEETIFALLEDGKTLIEVAATAQCSRPFLSKWLERNPERSERYRKAREQAAHALADDIQTTTDNVLQRAIEGKASKIEVAAAKLSTDTKKWTAGIWNNRYKENGQTNVAVNLDMGSLFLQAMRKPVQRPETTVIDMRAEASTEAIRAEAQPALSQSGETYGNGLTVPEFDVLEPARILKDDDYLSEPIQKQSFKLLDED
ncbi:hypothetical protein [Paraburkholderia caribensis]|uniref:terminase small subunit-like protein n=1 Tax=Paraburkholderia caribensis TaxID=75105 RepID=UPI00078C3A89|nr:hypothetical protein [Paraburkholderia caribensis]AMV42272.1 hypothetical protein ATN79_06215 [Paraburkholderia caribensis]